MNTLHMLRHIIMHNSLHTWDQCQLTKVNNKLNMDKLDKYLLPLNNTSGGEVRLRHILPGHGTMLFDKALIAVNDYIYHRELREQQIIAVCTQANSNQTFLTSWNIMKLIYCPKGKTPINFILQLSAQSNIIKHLLKLLEEKKVEKLNGWDLWRIKSN